MAIETSQYPKYRVNETDACCVQVQHKVGGRWTHYRRYVTEKAASKVVLKLSRIAPAPLLDQEQSE